MQIKFASNSGMARSRLLAYVKEARKADPTLRVVDLGGAGLPWTAEVADAFVDLSPSDKLPTIVGDLHDPELWSRIKAGGFNFCICSHTLEDLRDPLFVLGQINKTFQHGYIAIPSKHVEFGHIESRHYVGYGHHRWIFTLAPNALRVIAKFPFSAYFSPRRKMVARFKASAPAAAWRRVRGRKPGLSAVGPLPWWNEALAGPGNELAFVWTGSLMFEAINADYAGESLLALARLYRDELSTGL